MLVSQKKYSELCGCNIRTIRHRIDKKYIKTQKIKLPDGETLDFINTVRFPPVMIRAAGGGRKVIKRRNGKTKNTRKKTLKR